MIYRIQKFILALLIVAKCIGTPPKPNTQLIESLIKKYNRPITVLEIGQDSIDYLFPIASKYNIAGVGILLGDPRNAITQIYNKKYKNIVVLNPKKFDYNSIGMLSRCEYFDVVIIHDIYPLIKKEKKNSIDELLSLGNYTFIELPATHIFWLGKDKDKQLIARRAYENTAFSLYNYDKPGLDIPRWTRRKIPVSISPRYPIISNFNEKYFTKEQVSDPIPWLPGINLKTFVMLRGLYPDDKIIRDQLLVMESTLPYHNDLIIGNIIIQGDKIIPIDFNDKRRSANMHKCLIRAIELFNSDNSRLKDPEKRMEKYSKKI